MGISSDLIFDLGLHHGFDTRYYLAKGFRVVALDAVPAFCARAHEEFADAIAAGRLTVVQKALHDLPGQTVSFFFNPAHEDWGSLDRDFAERGAGGAVALTVQTATLAELFAAHGVPYYLKCDLEGGDAILARAMVGQAELPVFVSIEATVLDDLAMLRAAGYDRFQIVNQWMHFNRTAPDPPREGIHVAWPFNQHMSGLFGRELPADKWVDFETMARVFLAWYVCHRHDPEVGVGWLDVHATSRWTLGN